MALNSDSKTWLKGMWKTVKRDAICVNPGEVYRLTAAPQMIRILSGSAWITFNGQDMVLRKGRNVYLPTTENAGLVSAIGHAPVLFEIHPR
jgi:hypothetical protein